MLRLLQGDVGCGKPSGNGDGAPCRGGCGYQGAFMALTGSRHAAPSGAHRFIVSKGSGPRLRYSQVHEDCGAGATRRVEYRQNRIIVGTHALIHEKVSSTRLASPSLTSSTVSCRTVMALLSKGKLPHMLDERDADSPYAAMTKFGEMEAERDRREAGGTLPIITTVCSADGHSVA